MKAQMVDKLFAPIHFPTGGPHASRTGGASRTFLGWSDAFGFPYQAERPLSPQQLILSYYPPFELM